MREKTKDMVKRMFAHYKNRARPSKVTWDMYFLHTGFFYDNSQENRYLKIKKQKR
tara:strand:- start:190 stop:354 length:165 start_codon:yes stop_codon:yes gene_type:complete